MITTRDIIDRLYWILAQLELTDKGQLSKGWLSEDLYLQDFVPRQFKLRTTIGVVNQQ